MENLNEIEINNDAIGMLVGDFDEEEVEDLFNTWYNLPIEMQNILDKYASKGNSYTNCAKMLKECEKLGYTFEWGLDACPYELKKM